MKADTLFMLDKNVLHDLYHKSPQQRYDYILGLNEDTKFLANIVDIEDLTPLSNLFEKVSFQEYKKAVCRCDILDIYQDDAIQIYVLQKVDIAFLLHKLNTTFHLANEDQKSYIAHLISMFQSFHHHDTCIMISMS